MRWSSVTTRRLGAVVVAYIDQCPFFVSLGVPGEVCAWAQGLAIPSLVWDPHAPRALRAALRAVVDRGQRYAGPVGLVHETPFQQAVLLATRAIPCGETRTYGEMAAAIGRPRAARAVGSALAANPLPLLIPCHRVVGAGRRLGFYSDGGPDMKRRLLAYEGADVASFR
ncbi:methylated-DNA--[protein]-cysteine S-methyltransferase [Acidiferrobacter thiooxydans]|uniref:methylated-DNA--[protein]-cysteine S-methyltransferase n=1 Tax=Acidiferrobacter thiooxydans TaxID=163359 RepID=UPI001E59DBD8|nr:methylated-DNA--[protein]-cysteine S-methyltransferase [Acidiferrobacter thiooxydans]UEO00079.1 methylated-DNA--[protein]-cysteine S-methyltransferase [Acidiferrobacter thiooxydans]